MLGRIETRLRRLRRGLSRSRWIARALRLSAGPLNHRALVMVQIDGLSKKELHRSLQQGEMPFLARLLDREHYQLFSHYPGLPSSTPSVQGELFYGVSEIVPAFGFKDHKNNKLTNMLDPATAARLEAELKSSGNFPLLAGGSAYVNIFTGGADEPHFCPSSLGWGPALRRAHPLAVLLFGLANAPSFIRVLLLMLVEFGLAIGDAARGINRGYTLSRELRFIPLRVVICIVLRELARIGAEIDIERGLPVIHLNFLGYDEQAHRRGPDSLFAHWTLKGIDSSIERLWNACHRSIYAHYDLWIYSDHGQITTTPYRGLNGRSLDVAVTEIFQSCSGISAKVMPFANHQNQRVRLLGGEFVQKLFSLLGVESPINQWFSEQTQTSPPSGLRIAALGPVGFIYPDQTLSYTLRQEIARRLVEEANIPVVVSRGDNDQYLAWSAAGCFQIPEEGAAIFGAEHPYLDIVCRELINLCAHPDAGEFVLLGWRQGQTAVTFAGESGSHGGLTADECDAFALLPADTLLPKRQRHYLRPGDLRRAALYHLGREPLQLADKFKRYPGDTVRIMTYNVHFCEGMDGKMDPARIARVIARANPDIVALQELDVGRQRSEAIDQAHRIAQLLEMEYYFHPAMQVEEEAYGDAILTHLPMRLIKSASLPGPNRRGWEVRGALWVAVEVGNIELNVINTHLGLLPGERQRQIQTLLDTDWMGHPECRGPAVLCGDLNATPSSPVYKLLSERLRDAQLLAEQHQPLATFLSRMPMARIDHIFVNQAVEVAAIDIPKHSLARVASDHLPLVADLRII